MIRLLIADDHPIVREGLKRMIAECADMRVVGEAADSHELLAKAQRSSAPGLAFRRHAGGPAVSWEARLASVRHGSATSITEQTARPLPDQGLDKPS